MICFCDHLYRHRIPTRASGISEHVLWEFLMAERLGRNFSENIIQCPIKKADIQFRRPLFSNQIDISECIKLKCMPVLSEIFPRMPFNPVTNDGITNLSGNGDTQPGPVIGIGSRNG